MTVREEKAKQKYQQAGRGPKCANCWYFFVQQKADQYGYIKDKCMKCTLGNFATKRTCWCHKHEFLK